MAMSEREIEGHSPRQQSVDFYFTFRVSLFVLFSIFVLGLKFFFK